MGGMMSSGVTSGSSSSTDKAKRFLTNSIGVREDGRGGNVSGFLDPLELNWFSSPDELAQRAKEKNPEKAIPKPQVMPDKDTAAIKGARRRQSNQVSSSGGRASTIMQTDRLGG